MFSQSFIDGYRSQTPPWGFNGLGEIVYLRTYSRKKEDGTQEDWVDTIERCINGAQAIGAGYTQEEAERLFDHVFNLRCSFSGRGLWQLGTELGKQYGDSLNNCWAVSIKRPKDFLFLMHELLLGGGVGYSVEREHIHELPKVKKNVTVTHTPTKDADFIVPDSREGWVSLLEQVLNAYFKTGKSFTYSTILVRGKGEPIRQFGGKASGPLPLVDGITKISSVLNSRAGKKLRSVDVLDICNIIGSIVVSGNVRRSAQIAIGDADDVLFLGAKDWSTGNIPNWRAYSNNTIVADNYDYLSSKFWEGYEGNGEPLGLFNKRLSQTNGRLGELIEDACSIPNPCSEQILEPYESCNLAEIFLPNVESLDQLIDIAQLLYKTCKAITQMPYLFEESQEVIHRNARIGIGITGICQLDLYQKLWLDSVYEALRGFDNQWSDERGWNRSIKLTTLKPSGTLSLLAGVTPGVHPAFSQFYIRRVRMSSDDTLVQQCRDAGYHVEYAQGFDGNLDYSTSIVEFPVQSPQGTILARDMSAIKQLETVKEMQSLWSDSAVSVTVYYHKEELPAIKDWLQEHYETSLKAVSFLLHSEHGFVQAPYEEIDEATYNKRVAQLTHRAMNVTSGESLDVECADGYCPIK